jgi:hypothetical protein
MVFIIFSYLTIIGVLQFQLWSQVVDINNSGASLRELWGHPHFFRYLLVLPFFDIAQYIGMHYNKLFTLSIPIFLYLIHKYTILSIEIIWEKHRLLLLSGLHHFLVICLLVLVLSLMNGRIIFAILGAAIILYSFVNWDNLRPYNLMLNLLTSFFLCSVSSGTFTLTVLLAFMFVLYKLFRNKNKKEFLTFVPFLIAALALLPTLITLIKKNIDYYGGGFNGALAMLDHGFGRYFLSVDSFILIMLLITSLILFLFVLFFILYFERISAPIWVVLVSIAGGVFGFSTMMIFIPALIVIFVHAFFSMFKKSSFYA